jgi:hypothetical protein
MTRLNDHGISIDVPPGWEARMSVPRLPVPAVNLPVLHMADYPLTHARQSSYAVETAAAMGKRKGGIVVSLIEFGSELADVGLYEPRGAPILHPRDLDGRALQIPRPDQGGVQRFFSMTGRAFSLYVVASLDRSTARRLATLNASLSSLRVDRTTAPRERTP